MWYLDSMIDFFSPLRAKDVYMRPPCTLGTDTVHAFRAHQGRICASLTVGKKIARHTNGFKFKNFDNFNL